MGSSASIQLMRRSLPNHVLCLFRVSARSCFNILYRLVHRTRSIKRRDDLFVPDCLSSGKTLAKALIKKPRNLFDETMRHHGVNATINTRAYYLGSHFHSNENGGIKLRDALQASFLASVALPSSISSNARTTRRTLFG